MPALSFRLKLLLSMALVVVGVSVATLLVTQRRVQANYERMFHRAFERQITYFTALQETRLANVKDQCLKLSQKLRLISLLREQQIEPEALYLASGDELRSLLGDVAQEGRIAGLTGMRRFQATFFIFLDAKGKPIPAPDSVRKQFRLGLLARKRLEQKVAQVRGALASPERQQVGYLALLPETNRPAAARSSGAAARSPVLESADASSTPVLQEVIVTKIVDPVSDKVVGAMALGFPLPELIPQPRTNAPVNPANEPIQAAILLEDHLHASALPEPVASSLAERLAQRLHASPKVQDEFDCRLQGGDYRVFYQLLNQASAFAPAYQVCLYSMQEARREQSDLRWKILGSSGIALVGALLLSLLLSHGLSVPIRELAAGTAEIQRGNFAVQVPVRSGDEIGQLTASFNQMALGLAEKEKYRAVLNMVADEKVARRMMSGEITLGGEVREISVLFCDIRGFTPLTAAMPPAEVIEMLNEHMTALTKVVKEHNGVLDKFVGDLLMAIFGAPVSHEHDSLDAARCALRLLEERHKLNQTSRHKLEIGIGLATGKVVAGCMGSADRLNYTVLGERVNLASRLCDQAAGGEVLIDQTTFELLGDTITAQPAVAMQLKGFAGPVCAYKLFSVRATSA